MQRLGRNHDRYQGETIPIDDILQRTLGAARQLGWSIAHLDAAPGLQIPVLTRSPRSSSTWSPRFYVSTGIHGDEPAGPLAALRLVSENHLPDQAWLWLCPCLNPTGFQRNTRESAGGHDLNRDYRHRLTPEIQAHVAWLERQPLFDVALCLHEDWEAAGFYLYELNPEEHPSLARPVLDAVQSYCPIDRSPVIDGREAREGLICPSLDPAQRPQWPEAFYLLQNKTRLNYTFESPSDFPLEIRVQALVTAVETALGTYSPHRPSPVTPTGERQNCL